jgi:hypothetical protein
MHLIESLKQARLAKLEQIGLLSSGEMRTFLNGVDVSRATLSQEREEVEMIEAVLRELRLIRTSDNDD